MVTLDQPCDTRGQERSYAYWPLLMLLCKKPVLLYNVTCNIRQGGVLLNICNLFLSLCCFIIYLIGRGHN